MNRKLSLLLVLLLVLGTVPGVSFTADATAGENLKAMGLLKGDLSGNLNEQNELTRAEMMVVLSRMNKVEEEAMNYGVISTFIDSQSHWAANYISYGEREGWTMGTSATTFTPNGSVTFQQAATYMLRVLGYDDNAGGFSYENSMEKAMEVGILEGIQGQGSYYILRGELFIAMENSLDLVGKGKKYKLGVELGVFEMADYDMTFAEAKSNIVVEVELNKATQFVDEADFIMLNSDGDVLDVVTADLVDPKTVWLGTHPQAAGKVYTVISGEEEVDFTGVAKDKSLPVVDDESFVKDNKTVLVVYNKEMDRRNVLDPNNYTISNGLEVLSVEYNTDEDGDLVYDEVLLTTSSQVSGRLYKVTVERGVTDMDGNIVDREDDNNSFKFGGLRLDAEAPELSNVVSLNAEKITLIFDEDSDLTRDEAEYTFNYTITNKTNSNQVVIVESAEIGKDSDGMYTEVDLRT